ncbi:MAG TPA: transglycosylase domain-containing protein, partial [Rubrobacteraceae bacterium]|nr:transglycosylase domain-containing protein [Rubrobacteraceae bacterium]
MAGTHQRRRGGSATGLKPRKGPKSPASSKKKQLNSRKKKNIQAQILRRVGIVSLCCVVAALAFVVGGYLGLAKGVENLNEASAGPSHPTYIYSAPIGETPETTRVIGTIFQGENRQEAPLEDMPSSLLDALVAKEDERFREHGGVDLLGIMRALWIDIQMGGAVEGASTITQQYVRNAYLTGDRSLARKIKEAAIAVEVERKYEKDEILGMYLNTVYFGSNAYGVEAAAETYFNKSAEELTVADSATLIGLLWSPSSLGNNREEATKQRNFVLYKMREAGYINRQEHMKALDEALPEPWPKAPMVQTGLTGPPATKNFAEFVREELVKRYGTNAVLTGGLSVYTTLDLKAQVTAQKMLYDPSGYLSRPQDPDAALVSVEPDTGHITAMVGSRDEESQFNLVTQARRQPGSSFKPFALIAALEQGIDPSTQFVSEKKKYTITDENGRTEEWEVENYENENHGTTDLRHALWLSDNSVFTDLVTNAEGRGLKEGPEAVVDVAKRLGITAALKAHPSIVLGTQEVSPMDMAIAYATIANGGKKVTPTAIEKVVQNEGQEDEKVLDAAPREEGEQVIAPEVARKATEIMVGNIDRGIAQKASLGDRPAAGKTGTSENFFDSWFIGFTPQLVTGVWMG